MPRTRDRAERPRGRWARIRATGSRRRCSRGLEGGAGQRGAGWRWGSLGVCYGGAAEQGGGSGQRPCPDESGGAPDVGAQATPLAPGCLRCHLAAFPFPSAPPTCRGRTGRSERSEGAAASRRIRARRSREVCTAGRRRARRLLRCGRPPEVRRPRPNLSNRCPRARATCLGGRRWRRHGISGGVRAGWLAGLGSWGPGVTRGERVWLPGLSASA